MHNRMMLDGNRALGSTLLSDLLELLGRAPASLAPDARLLAYDYEV
jgi:hypothetical protein